VENVIAASVRSRRVVMALFAIFAGLALLMAAVGIYGILSYAVGQRTHEIGIRMALGAGHDDVVLLVVAAGMRPVIAGAAIGVGAALGLSRLLTSLLYRVAPADPLTYALGLGLVLVVALLSCYLPARRATLLDPLLALRSE
jgi:putative ABC transport system permease protein